MLLEDDYDDYTSVVLPGGPPVPSGEAQELGEEPMVFCKIRKVSTGRAKALPANRLYVNKLKQLDVSVSMHKAHSVDLTSQSCIVEGNFAATDFSSAILVLSVDTLCKAAVRGDVLRWSGRGVVQHLFECLQDEPEVAEIVSAMANGGCYQHSGSGVTPSTQRHVDILRLLQQIDLVVSVSGNGDSMWKITDKGSRVLRHASSMEQCQKVFSDEVPRPCLRDRATTYNLLQVLRSENWSVRKPFQAKKGLPPPVVVDESGAICDAHKILYVGGPRTPVSYFACCVMAAELRHARGMAVIHHQQKPDDYSRLFVHGQAQAIVPLIADAEDAGQRLPKQTRRLEALEDGFEDDAGNH